MARACSWFITEVRMRTSLCRCRTNCRTSRSAGDGIQMRGNRWSEANRGCAGHPASRSSAFVPSSRGSPPHLPPKARGDIPGVLSRTTAHSRWLLCPPERVRKVMRKNSAPHPSHVSKGAERQWGYCTQDRYAFLGEVDCTFRNGRLVSFEVSRGITT